MPTEWAWIPITVFAAFAQTLRNATQRKLVGELGTLGATLVRFVYGAPFAALWLAIVCAVTGLGLPGTTRTFFAWVTLGAASQIVATAALLRTMQARSFALGVAYSKTEILLVALFGLVFLGDTLSVPAMLAVLLGTLGVLLLAPADPERPLRALLTGWTSAAARWGLVSGACFALAAVAFRGATLQTDTASPLLSAATTLLVAQLLQSVMLGGYLAARQPRTVRAVLVLWRPSLFAGFMGAAASAGWFTAFALSSAAHVRTLGLVELLFSYAISLKLFRERFTRREIAGMLLLVAGLVLVTLRG
ncbi:MAG: EamA/RhaT family transporter [Burkholderiaceae bacterium]|nr:EamA/RhaT family transporter [Burkholderiaceae bacterium]